MLPRLVKSGNEKTIRDFFIIGKLRRAGLFGINDTTVKLLKDYPVSSKCRVF